MRAKLQQQEELLVQKQKQLLAFERQLQTERGRADTELSEVQGATREALQHVKAMEAEKQQLEQHLHELQEAAAKMEQEVRRWKEVGASIAACFGSSCLLTVCTMYSLQHQMLPQIPEYPSVDGCTQWDQT